MASGLKNLNLSQYRSWMQKRIEFSTMRSLRPRHPRNSDACGGIGSSLRILEAGVGIEPASTALQVENASMLINDLQRDSY